jgi:hypothetical protein
MRVKGSETYAGSKGLSPGEVGEVTWRGGVGWGGVGWGGVAGGDAGNNVLNPLQ